MFSLIQHWLKLYEHVLKNDVTLAILAKNQFNIWHPDASNLSKASLSKIFNIFVLIVIQ